jgi:hypothetical protein
MFGDSRIKYWKLKEQKASIKANGNQGINEVCGKSLKPRSTEI